MDTLPSEIVSQVFLWAIPRHHYRDQFVGETTNIPQAKLSLVCRYWEQVVVNTPEIWSYIHLTPENTEETLTRRLLLSKNEPLDVRIDVGDDGSNNKDHRDHLRRLRQLVSGSVLRWRSFVFQGSLLFNSSPRKWIPEVLPNVVEAAYYALVEDDNEGLDIFDDELEAYVEYRFEPWTSVPKLKRFHVETSGQFWFTDCPLITEYSIGDIREWWGGSPDRRSWHDKWDEYFVRLASSCPQLKVLEIKDMPDEPGVDWPGHGSEWPEFPNLRTLNLDSLIEPIMIPVLSKLKIPNAQTISIGHVHKCLPITLGPLTLQVNQQTCHVSFTDSPLHAVRVFLGHVSRKEELNVSINLRDAFGIRYDFVDERGDDPMTERSRIIEDYNWIKANTRSVVWGIPDEVIALLSDGSEMTGEAVAAFCMMWKFASLRRHRD